MFSGKNKTTVYLVIIAIVLAAWYFFFNSSSSEDQPLEDQLPSPDETNVSTAQASYDWDVDVSFGSSNHTVVKIVQKMLNAVIVECRSFKAIDTEKEARRKQIADKKYLVADGVFGNKTKEVMYAVLGKYSGSHKDVHEKLKQWEYINEQNY